MKHTHRLTPTDVLDGVQLAAEVVIVLVIPVAVVYLVCTWLAGPFAIAALPLALCLALVGLAQLVKRATRKQPGGLP